ncbi:glycosyltransferase family 2 protein [Paramicrobacterium chengjingii]|uniref:Glycosyltransferase family 2 protein n=1 Tax=Paramicrobacterium chengjingii TaxID=2769067 RepID=A0ABX6YEX4_9MICO|nr:glycosyltransferase family 2 protein [Microbacterium chengjingii]QPZ37317.1 glycosyltransferase family 2 protein [Microbacterium chengjingii]
METRVTALVVAHRDVEHLRRTLDALDEQTRRADAVIAIAFDASDDVRRLLEERHVDRLVTSKEQLTFGRALAEGERTLADPESDDEFLWLLAQDNAPQARALELLLARFETAPSAAVAGPKLVDWNDGSRLRGIGETVTTHGKTVAYVDDQLDQGQYDTMSDVLAVASPGMLVRRTVWRDLNGFDPALGPIDDGLDFCIRARLTGKRVVLAPGSMVAVSGDGIAGAPRSRRWSVKQRRARLSRTAELHRRLVYAPGVSVFWHWLLLIPLAILRSIWLLVRKQPELIAAEFRAAAWVAFGGTRVPAARRRLASAKTVGWSSLADLKISTREHTRRKRLEREDGVPLGSVERSDLRFFTGGGAWIMLASLVVGAILFIRFVPATTLSGGGLLPLTDDVWGLWQNIGYGWRSVGDGFVGAADPFAVVLAILGTLTFWQPSYSLVVLWILALPLATLTAWFATTRLTERSGFRNVGAIAWTLSPTFLIALAEGRPAAVVAHILLPVLFSAGVVASRSWGAAAAASLLLALVAACAPSLIPALLLLWLAAVLIARARFGRVLFIPAPFLALFGPLMWQQGVEGGRWIALLADPGKPLGSPGVSVTDLLLGLPQAGFAGWRDAADALGLPPALIDIGIPVLVGIIALIGLYGLFLPGATRRVALWGMAALGFATAVGAAHIAVTFVGVEPTSIWPGPGLSLMWLGIVGAAVSTCDSLRARGNIPAIVAGVSIATLALPALLIVPLGAGAVASSDGRTLPAYVTAAADDDPGLGTLRISPTDDGTVVATVIRGKGEFLDSQSTLVNTGALVADANDDLARLTGNIVSVSGHAFTPDLQKQGIEFLLLSTTPDSASEKLQAVAVRAETALDANAELENVGETEVGTLWRTADDVTGRESGDVQSVGTVLSLAALIAMTLIALLVAIPTSSSREAARMSPRTVGRREHGEGMVVRDPLDDQDFLADPDAEAEPEWADVVSLPGVEPSARSRDDETEDDRG